MSPEDRAQMEAWQEYRAAVAERDDQVDRLQNVINRLEDIMNQPVHEWDRDVIATMEYRQGKLLKASESVLAAHMVVLSKAPLFARSKDAAWEDCFEDVMAKIVPMMSLHKERLDRTVYSKESPPLRRQDKDKDSGESSEVSQLAALMKSLIEENKKSGSTQVETFASVLSSNQDMLATLKAPTIKVKPFGGGPLEDFLAFQRAFKHAYEVKGVDQVNRMTALRDCLVGDASGMLNAMDTTEEAYKEAWVLLERTYGGKDKAKQRVLKAVADASPVTSDKDYVRLRKLLDLMYAMDRTYASYGITGEGEHNITLWTSKLPVKFGMSWVEGCVGKKWDRGDSESFLRFLTDKVEAAEVWHTMQATVKPQDKDPKASKGAKGTTSTGAALTATVASTGTKTKPAKPAPKPASGAAVAKPPQGNKCPGCKEVATHDLARCPKWASMTPKARFQVCISYWRCTVCLKKGHNSKDCPDKGQCQADPACKYWHHRSLHRP